jgi:hypothetical protein
VSFLRRRPVAYIGTIDRDAKRRRPSTRRRILNVLPEEAMLGPREFSIRSRAKSGHWLLGFKSPVSSH